jgi:hypothetical protein
VPSDGTGKRVGAPRLRICLMTDTIKVQALEDVGDLIMLAKMLVNEE